MIASEENLDTEPNYYEDRRSLSSTNLATYGMVRSYMNGAVCVGSAVDLGSNTSTNRNALRKRISCSCSKEHVCPTHLNEETTGPLETTSKEKGEFGKDILEDGSYPTSSRGNLSRSLQRQKEMYNEWMAKKNAEKKKISQNQVHLKTIEEKEKQTRIKQEQENFEQWLIFKNKKTEQKKKLELEQDLLREQKKEVVKQRRSRESRMKFDVWLKKKEQAAIDDKLNIQMESMKVREEKELRSALNQNAFKNWLTVSKTKQKPIPLSQGLDSLRSAASVTFVNPLPWVHPTIEESKSTSQ